VKKKLDIAEMQLKNSKKAESGSGQQVITPNREWFQTRNDRLKEKESLRLDGYSKKKRLTVQEREELKKTISSAKTAEDRARFEMKKCEKFQVREAKKSQRSSRLNSFNDEKFISSSDSKKSSSSSLKRKRPSSSFENELVNVPKIDKIRNKSSTMKKQPPSKRKKKH